MADIKPAANTLHFQYFSDQFELARRLDAGFQVTHGARLDDLAFWIVQPDEAAKQRLGLTRELLAVYSKHPKTDARVLTAVERVLGLPDYRRRLERVVVLLVHNGDPQDTLELLRSQTDHVIVPLRSDE